MKPPLLRIAIIGCGTAGPAAAILLKRQGHEVALFERAEECKSGRCRFSPSAIRHGRFGGAWHFGECVRSRRKSGSTTCFKCEWRYIIGSELRRSRVRKIRCRIASSCVAALPD
ncbi:MAG: FAD-dependent oxidoreductase [Akkermansiaceae bacterium]|nr:FAD-dependent oxidoreductase [Akkermansiaceae bacterium]